MLSILLSIFLNAFVPPVDYDMILAGNFGEPRPHHFHGGVDVKTDGVEGKHIYSIADGYVSRVTRGLYGFGNAVYVTHPTGQTSVYCHLQRFSSRITRLLRRWQYQHKSSVADARFAPLDCPVSAGQLIALSGNTGHSTGPHLHLEVHDTRTWHMLDPLDFIGAYVSDTVAPRLHGLMAVPLGGIVNGGTSQQTLGACKELTAWGRVGFAIWANDYMQQTYNHYGIRETILMVDGKEVFHSNVNDIPVEHNLMVNYWGDYDHWLRNHVWYMKSYVEPGNRLSMLRTDESRGVLDVSEERDYHLEYILRDFKANESHYQVVVHGVRPSGNVSVKTQKPSKLLFRWDQTNSYSRPGMQLVVPYGLLGSDIVLAPVVHRQPEAYSDAYSFVSRSCPLLGDGKIYLYPHRQVQDFSKLYVRSNGRFMGGDVFNGWVVGRLRDLAFPCELDYDDTPPLVRLQTNGQRVTFTATDEQSGIGSWTATIDGRFVVFDFHEKSRTYTCDLSETWLKPGGGQHSLCFSVTDNRNNTAKYETTITY